MEYHNNGRNGIHFLFGYSLKNSISLGGIFQFLSISNLYSIRLLQIPIWV